VVTSNWNVVGAGHVELVLEERDQSGDHVQHTDRHHHDGGEHGQAARPWVHLGAAGTRGGDT